MAELAKIVRVIRKRDPEAPHNTLLVLDATTGQNALSQVEIFRRIADVTGAGDDQARRHGQGRRAGGARRPLRAADPRDRGRREIDDLAPFDPEEFARALTGLDRRERDVAILIAAGAQVVEFGRACRYVGAIMAERHINPIVKLVLEVGPIAVFFLAYRMAPLPRGSATASASSSRSCSRRRSSSRPSSPRWPRAGC